MQQKVVVMITGATAGRGSDELGGILIRNFLRMIRDNDARPTTLVFMNGGVHLTCQGSPVKDELTTLSGLGLELLSCGTCLDFFEIRDKLEVGKASNMGEIYLRLTAADKVITL